MSISFVIATLSSILWFLFSFRNLNFESVFVNPEITILFQTIVILILPILLIWVIYFAAKDANDEKAIANTLYFLGKQLKNSSENNSSIQQAVSSAEKEIKRGFILQKFDFLISDVNELLSDIIKRSNSISSIQMEHLWNRTAGGEHWLIAKTFIEIDEYQTGFMDHLLQKALKDNLLKGSILEFDTRYKNLCQLLSKYDNQQIFSGMIEFGALGKVHRILSPLAEKLYMTNSSEKPSIPTKKESSEENLTIKSDIFPSFLTPKDLSSNNISTPQTIKKEKEEIKPEEDSQSEENIISGFTQTQTALRNLESPLIPNKRNYENETAKKISLDEIVKEINASPDNNYDEDEHPLEALFDEKSNQ